MFKTSLGNIENFEGAINDFLMSLREEDIFCISTKMNESTLFCCVVYRARKKT